MNIFQIYTKIIVCFLLLLPQLVLSIDDLTPISNIPKGTKFIPIDPIILPAKEDYGFLSKVHYNYNESIESKCWLTYSSEGSEYLLNTDFVLTTNNMPIVKLKLTKKQSPYSNNPNESAGIIEIDFSIGKTKIDNSSLSIHSIGCLIFPIDTNLQTEELKLLEKKINTVGYLKSLLRDTLGLKMEFPKPIKLPGKR